MQRLRIVVGAALALAAFAGGAQATDVRIRNISGDTIYSMYAWPSDFVPDTFSIITSPLRDGEIRLVDIDNRYSRCQFTLQLDYNDPRATKKFKEGLWSKKRFQKLRVNMKILTLNLCKLDGDAYVIRNRN